MNPAERHFEISRSLFREANDAFFLFDPQTQMIVDLNPAALRLTGLEKDTACSMRLEELFAGSAPGGLDALTQALARTGFFHSREGYLLKRPSKDPLPVNLSVSRIHTEPEPVGLIVARDISDRKKAEEALKQVETRYTSLIASTGVMVWEIDASGIIESISPAFETITGWSRGDWIGRPLVDLLHAADRETARLMHERASRGETLPRYELRIRTKVANWLDCEFLLVTKIREGATERILGIVRDITERRRTELALEQAALMRRAKEEAERANRAKSEFLSSVSHELRTPLSAILGFADVLDEHPYLRAGPTEIKEYLGTVLQNGQFLLALIDDLLDISRIEAGQLRVEREPCFPARIVADAVEALRTKAEAKQLRVDVEVAETLPSVIASDRLRLQQILVNLLDNAIKFSERGMVRLTARMIEQAGGQPVLQFAVSDNGIGMTAAEMSELFQPFYRVRSRAQESPAGTGLGLAICKRIAKRLGGDITVESDPESGSIFTLTIPAEVPRDLDDFAPAEELRDQTSAVQSPAPASRLDARILVTDDNLANQRLICLRLSRAGAEVVTAGNGEEALDRANEAALAGHPFDAVIMDMQMPVLDGYEAVPRLRAHGFTNPILAVTAYAMSEDREECLRLGCDDFISKPIEWDRLLSKLTRLLAAKNGVSSHHVSSRD
jgi:PAS domain S-box-containing protein